jgi:hypothetical protein
MRTAYISKTVAKDRCGHYREGGLAHPGTPLYLRVSSRLAAAEPASTEFSAKAPGRRAPCHSSENNRRILFSVTFSLNLKRQAPLLGALQLVHAAGQISYLLI